MQDLGCRYTGGGVSNVVLQGVSGEAHPGKMQVGIDAVVW